MSDKDSPLPSTAELKDDVTAATKSTFQSLRALVAGGVGGVCAVVVGHPFDLVKVRLQTADKGMYSGAMDVVRRTIAREGLARGLYAGVSAPLVGVTPMFAVSFWGYDVGKQIVTSLSPPPPPANGDPNSAPPPPPSLSIAQISTAGLLSALPMTLITAPFERVKVLLQIQGQKTLGPGEKAKYSGGLDVVRQLYREGGLRSVFRGGVMTFARDGPGSAAYFATYEYVKRRLSGPPPPAPDGGDAGPPSLMAVMAAGGAAGVAMWIPVFPVDTVKSRLQGAEGGVRPTILGTVRDVYVKGGGVRGFFPGLGPALARAVPANAATFLGVELAHMGMRRVLDGGES